MLEYLLLVIIVSAASGTDKPFKTFKFTEPIEYDSIEVPVLSSTYRCMNVISERYCKRFFPTVNDCAKGALLFWQRGLAETPDFVEEYFNAFKDKLIAAKFQLPYEFCYNDAQPYNSKVNERTMECNSKLEEFKASPSTLISSIYRTTINSDANDYELKKHIKEVRKDILNYAFFETRINNYSASTLNNFTTALYGRIYLLHIYNFIKVNESMDTPKEFCIKKNTLYNAQTGSWNIF